MALAQDFSMSAAVVEEHDELDRPSQPRGRQPEEGRLARMVRELHELEDDIAAKLTAAERLLVQLESRRVHEDGGYASRAEFEHRMLAGTPVLRAMREAAPPSPTPSAKLSLAKRDPAEARARQTKALTSIARALDRLRGLDREIYECATTARSTLSAIEGMRIFDECGYVSFEEFLERALGPSPILASVVALVASMVSPAPLPTGHQAGEPPAPTDASDSARMGVDESPFADSSSLFEAPPPFAPSGDAGPATGPIATDPEGISRAEAARPAESNGAAPPARRRFMGILVSVILCALATVAGAAAGVWSEMATSALRAGESTANASAQAHPSKAMTARTGTAAAPAAAPEKGSAERH